jgi:Polysaccharide pyruvyl transferase
MRISVLGFYHRDNLGDDAYVRAIPEVLFPGTTSPRPDDVSFEFLCIDDLSEVSTLSSDAETDMVIVGGGDVILPYFMDVLQRYLKNFGGPVYALSVGVPFSDAAPSLSMFDHVFVRSQGDLERAASTRLSSDDVSRMRDATMGLAPRLLQPLTSPSASRTGSESGDTLTLAVCLANPTFEGSRRKDALKEVAAGIASFAAHLLLVRSPQPARTLAVRLLSFNTHMQNHVECDHYLNRDLRLFLEDAGVTVRDYREQKLDEAQMCASIREADLVLAGRYHAALFCALCGVRCVTLSHAPKMASLMRDLGCADHDWAGPLPCDDGGARLDAMLRNRLTDEAHRSWPELGGQGEDFADVRRIVLGRRLRVPRNLEVVERQPCDVVLARCRNVLMHTVGEPPARVAEMLCTAITRDPGSNFAWGLGQAIASEGFDMEQHALYIYEESLKDPPLATGSTTPIWGDPVTHDAREAVRVLRAEMADWTQGHCATRRCADGSSSSSRVWWDLEDTVRNDYDKLHRHGWSYAECVLQAASARHFVRRGAVLIDGFADSTFHWHERAKLAMGVLPYRRSWIGVLHHTFLDEPDTGYNCVTLFQRASFLASLCCCLGLVVLTEDLAARLRKSLDAAGFPGVRVGMLDHPIPTTVFDASTASFDVEAFLADPMRQVVQVGSWLRDPFGIYALAPRCERLPIRKATLIGQRMHDCFPCGSLKDTLAELSKKGKFERGVSRHLAAVVESVTVIPHLDNAAYDALLSRSVIFLALRDCGAVNTVLECIMSATPVVVNRLPGLEEVLGCAYPAFYTDLVDAARILDDPDLLRAAHLHLKGLDRGRFSGVKFLRGMQDFARCCLRDADREVANTLA